MGSDRGPLAVLEGVVEAHKNIGDLVHFRLHGNVNVLNPLLKRLGLEESCYTLIHSPHSISPTDNRRAIVVALRQSESSMLSAIRDVKEGRASAVVSGGNTGALGSLSFRVLGCIKGLESFAICARIPAVTPDFESREVLLLDQGAEVEVSPDKLLANARMGALAAQIILGTKLPSVKFLNVGAENHKGNKVIQEARRFLEKNPENLFRFEGFIEGHEVMMGLADVVVTDGFTGNVWLKASEGVGGYIKRLSRVLLKQKPYLVPLFVLAIPFLLALRRGLDYNNYNGGVIIGLDGLVVKSHGAAKPKGIARAIRVTFDLAERDFIATLKKKFV